MNHVIVTMPSAEIRRISRRLLAGNWGKVFLGMFLAIVMMDMIPQFFDACIPFGKITQYNEALGINQSYSVIAYFYRIFFTGVFTAGVCSFFLSFVRMRDINPGYVFNGFEYYLKTLGLMLVMGLFVVLWSLLLIVPGIIASLRYSQAFYILADDPGKGIMQCINESKARMQGNKAKFFCLTLSFIGWIILAAIPSGVLGGILGATGMINGANVAAATMAITSSVPGFIATFIGTIPMAFAMLYLTTAETVFYEIITAHMVFRRPEEQVQDGALLTDTEERKDIL